MIFNVGYAIFTLCLFTCITFIMFPYDMASTIDIQDL